MLIDFHTHAPLAPRYTECDDVYVIQSLMPGECPDPRANAMTIGIHPMQPDAHSWMEMYRDDPERAIGEFINLLLDLQTLHPGTSFFGIGECGWDKRSETMTLEEQTLLFRLHETAARALNLPVILHIVGGWHLTLSERLKSPFTKWFVHGFRGKPALLHQLQSADITVSLSPSYAWEELPPLGTFLLETDESGRSLYDIYDAAAAKYLIDRTELGKQILYCFNKI